MISLCYSQANFKWEKVDSTLKTKNQIYSDTKMFIAETWKSAKDVIQNDDKETGLILIKGVTIESVSLFMATYKYVYNYTITFKMKDNKYKIILDNVNCEEAIFSGRGSIAEINPFEGDNCPPTGTLSHPGLPRGKAISMMANLKFDLQSIIDRYMEYIKKPSKGDEGW